MSRAPARPVATAAAIAVLAVATAAFAAALWLRVGRNVWATTSFAALLTLAVALPVLGRERLRKLASGGLVSAGLGAAAGVAMAAVTHAGYAVVERLVPSIRAEVAALYGALEATPGPLAALPLVVVVVVAEEIVWRGVAHDLLARWLAPVAVVLAQAVLYALPQLASHSVVLPLVGIYGGLAWGAARLAADDLVAPISMHLVWDVLLFVLIPLEG